MGVLAKYLSVSEDELALYQDQSSLLEERINEMKVDDANWINIDRSWDGIIYLLTGQGLNTASGKLLRVIVSTQYVDESLDFGYGPAHYLDASEVKELYAELAKWDKAKLFQRFDADEMRALGIYPDIWEEADAFAYLFYFFESIKRFYKSAAENNQAIIGLMSCEVDDLEMEDSNTVDQEPLKSPTLVQKVLNVLHHSDIVEHFVFSLVTIVASELAILPFFS